MIMRLLPIAALAIAGTAAAQVPSARPPAAQPAPPPVPTRVTAGVLANLCTQNRDACLTYVLGAVDAYAAALVASGRPQVFCPPRGTTNNQIADVAVTFVRRHPEEAQTNGSLVVLAALRAAYPCGQ